MMQAYRTTASVQETNARRAHPATPADLHRLAAQAHAKGVTLLPECLTGAWFATSASRPGEIHRLTGFSCICKGFTSTARCMHHALLLERLGWLPESPDDEPEPPAPPRRMTFGLTADELVVLRGPAARVHSEGRGPLVDGESGEILAV